MRIIRGSQKGRKISLPKGFKSRPTTDFAKESLFNILDNLYYFDKATVLDLFAGTGNISLEFFSRGCTNVTSVEINKRNSYHIEKQIEEFFPSLSNVITADVYRFCKNSNLAYKIIFADPPFFDKNIKLLPELIFNNPSVLEDTLFILEHSAKNNFSDSPFFKESRKYGNVNFTFFEKK
ncbi:MAG: methyltransferase [Chlorobi bacterium]|nr:methyltransferase [Chlorobiota bacterium]